MKNIISIQILFVGLLLFASIVWSSSRGSDEKDAIRILRPVAGDSLSYDQGQLFLLSVDKTQGENLFVLTQWKLDRVYEIGPKESRENFAREFYKLFEQNTTLEVFSYSFKLFKGYTKPETLRYTRADEMSIRTLWQQPAFTKLVKNIQTTGASEVLLSLRGWKEYRYVPTYEDPTTDGRWLYKIHVKLIPGINTLGFSIADVKGSEIEFVTNYVNDSKPVESRSNLFHNSKLEESCSVCHEGLPSSTEGKSMKADCAVCHKAKLQASYLHAPVEMKECGSCHNWSAEKKLLTIEKGVPATCFTCHDEKQAQVENSEFPHPVAGECVTCHSPHGSETKHLVKGDVYTLCTGCHEEQKLNHPVGRHPLRNTLMKNGEEISCASCHNPHGSKTEFLFRTAAGRLEMCSECH